MPLTREPGAFAAGLEHLSAREPGAFAAGLEHLSARELTAPGPAPKAWEG